MFAATKTLLLLLREKNFSIQLFIQKLFVLFLNLTIAMIIKVPKVFEGMRFIRKSDRRRLVKN